MNRIVLLFFIFIPLLPMMAAPVDQPRETATLTGNRVYNIMVYENQEEELLSIKMPTRSDRSLFFQSLLSSIKGAASATLSGQVATLAERFLSATVESIIRLVPKSREWQQRVLQDSQFHRMLVMNEELRDFYGNTSSRGALDPDQIVFNGFGCQEFIRVDTMINGEKNPFLFPVFDLRCSMDTTQAGMQHILYHSKFNVRVEHVFINPSLCDLPNDSLSMDKVEKYRVPFDFNTRKNLCYTVNAHLSSSWINEAIMIFKDQPLGSFKISISLPDTSCLIKRDGMFYFEFHRMSAEELARLSDEERALYEKKEKCIHVEGESFIVPRSFVGTEDGKSYERIWGTGQYKIDMELCESCDIRMDAYMKEDATGKKKLDNKKWQREWRKMEGGRQYAAQPYKTLWTEMQRSYGRSGWVHTIVDPVTTSIVSTSKTQLNQSLNTWMKLSSDAPGQVKDVSLPAAK